MVDRSSSDKKKTYRQNPLALLFGTNNKLLFAQILAHSNGIQSILETRKFAGPFGSFLGFDEKVYQFFT